MREHTLVRHEAHTTLYYVQDSVPDRPARPPVPEQAADRAARPPVPQPRRASGSPHYDPLFNPIIAISSPVAANNSASMASGAGALSGTANTATTGVQTVSANSAQSPQAVNNALGTAGQPCAPGHLSTSCCLE